MACARRAAALEQFERGQQRAPRVVVDGDRGAEQGQKTVAKPLRDLTVAARNDILGQREDIVQ